MTVNGFTRALVTAPPLLVYESQLSFGQAYGFANVVKVDVSRIQVFSCIRDEQAFFRVPCTLVLMSALRLESHSYIRLVPLFSAIYTSFRTLSVTSDHSLTV